MISNAPDASLDGPALLTMRLSLHRRNAPAAVFAALASCTLLAALLWSAITLSVLLPWLAAVLLALAVRTAVWQLHRRQEARGWPWLVVYRVSFALHGALPGRFWCWARPGPCRAKTSTC